MRRGKHQVRCFLDLFGDGNERVDEQIQFGFTLGLSGLDHHRAGDDEREAHGVGMKSVVDQALGDVAGVDAALGLALVAEDAFVHAWALDAADRSKALAACGGSWR